MKLFPGAIRVRNMQMTGCNKRLGLLSFRGNLESLFYAHIVEKDHGSTTVSIAPGLSYLGERDQSEVPESRIQQIMSGLNHAIKDDDKSRNRI
jgi:hypothetical protein